MKNYLTCSAGVVATALLLTALTLPAQPVSPDISPKAVLDAVQQVADWQLAHPVTNRPTGWVAAAGDVGMMALAGISGDAKYREAMLAKGEANHWELPAHQGRQYHADDQCIGQTYAELYFLHREPKMIAPMRERFDWILSHPSDAPGLDFTQPHGKSQELWSWCDSLFMAGCACTPRRAMSSI
jgi:unsaturated rhamnogalacturonyl hydrolase